MAGEVFQYYAPDGTCKPGYKSWWTGAVPGTGAHMCQSTKLGLTPTELAALPLDPIQISVRPTGTTSLLTIRGKTYEEALAKLSYHVRAGDPFGQTALRIVQQYEENKPRELFPGALALASVVASAGVAAAGAPAFVSATLSQLSEQVERSQAGMGLNISGLLGGIGQALGGINTSAYGNISQILGAGAQIAGAALAPTPSYAMPGYQPPLMQTQPNVYQTAAGSVPVFAAAGAAAAGAIARMTQPILFKIAQKLGLKHMPSLTRAMDMVRKMAKLLASPEAVAVALGITTAELATLITAQSSKKRRRMNPANSKALRRAARRIKSFHRLCTHTDVLKSRGRRSAGRSCGTCRKSPCRC